MARQALAVEARTTNRALLGRRAASRRGLGAVASDRAPIAVRVDPRNHPRKPDARRRAADRTPDRGVPFGVARFCRNCGAVEKPGLGHHRRYGGRAPGWCAGTADMADAPQKPRLALATGPR